MKPKPTDLDDLGGKRVPQSYDQEGISLTPTPPPKIDLRDAHAIRRELAAVYRDMRVGAIETQDGTRLAYVLDQIRKACEASLLQDRIEVVERIINLRRT